MKKNAKKQDKKLKLAPKSAAKTLGEYNPKKIEKKWQTTWDKEKTYQTLPVKKAAAKKQKPYYVLDMFPYPSGVGLHVGHPRGYIGSDVFARQKRMQGFNVLHPMGYDAFGLPAEQYAIEHNINPKQAVAKNVATFEKQLSIIGLSYDWSRKVNTTDPKFYKWTQWIFLEIYNSWYDKTKNKARKIDELVKIFEKSGNQQVHAASEENISAFTAKEWKAFSELEKQNVLMKYRLAFEGYSEVNWCPQLGTVLANDEIVEKNGKFVSERGGFPVEKKSMRQWFMRITAYADRLLTGLDGLDWSEHIKEIQRNWIGKSEGSEIEFSIAFANNEKSQDQKIKVFTTRADTLFGVTYVVLAPEHALINELKPRIKNWSAVEKYISEIKNKTEEDRMASKEKTGVVLEGIFAINPANNEHVPVWIADYVLAGYGTGAVMAVPAHDERDFEFAKKYNLNFKQVVEPLDINMGPGTDAYRPADPIVPRSNVVCIVEHPTEDKFLCAVWKQSTWKGFVTGGIEEGASLEETAREEINQETGYQNIGTVRVLDRSTHGLFYHVVKKNNRLAHYRIVHAKLLDLEKTDPTDEEKSIAEFVWVDGDKVHDFLLREDMKYPWRVFRGHDDSCITSLGILSDSGQFNGMRSEEAKKAITEFVGGTLVTKYKMRDAIFARQRYWGEPIPLVHEKDGKLSELSFKKLPLELPPVKSYQPTGTGESPLASVKSWMKAGYETNTMPGWAGSSWYFLRYMDPANAKAFAGKDEMKYWKNVDMYVGGAEHATGHLLYSRFWNKFLYDMGYIPMDEPFKALRNQGMILASDGGKMSKRNPEGIVNPDDIVNTYGADTLRLYEAFMGPFQSSIPWSTESIIGSRRFIERVWKLALKVQKSNSKNKLDDALQSVLQKTLHKTIKKVTDDIQNFSFNTAVSAMMILVNEMDRAEEVAEKDFKMFLQILAPFAAHVTEELWVFLGEKKSIHLSPWPKYDPKLVTDDRVTLGIQVNGKVRAEISIGKDADEAIVKEAVLSMDEVKRWMEGKELKKFIYIKGKIISVVV